MIRIGFPSCTRSVSFVENFQFSLPFPPADRPAFHEAVLDEILQGRVEPRRHRRNRRCVKRKMSNFPLKRRTDKQLRPINMNKAIKVLKKAVRKLK